MLSSVEKRCGCDGGGTKGVVERTSCRKTCLTGGCLTQYFTAGGSAACSTTTRRS